jgi:hypothetical protein
MQIRSENDEHLTHDGHLGVWGIERSFCGDVLNFGLMEVCSNFIKTLITSLDEARIAHVR